MVLKQKDWDQFVRLVGREDRKEGELARMLIEWSLPLLERAQSISSLRRNFRPDNLFHHDYRRRSYEAPSAQMVN